MRLCHEIDQHLELNQPGLEAPLWRYTYGGKPKPFFHPLHTPAGFNLSLFEPHDHIWHRGLWFTIKFINKENFWEETDAFGTQQPVLAPTVRHGVDGVIEWTHDQRWMRPEGASCVFEETRHITYRPIDHECYAIDWDVQLTAQADLELDRTPFTTWGGYGGLILRGNRNWQQTRVLLSDDSTHERPTGQNAVWGDLSGIFDGAADRWGGLAIFDHPENRRHPSPWYGATGAGHYLNAAFLFHEPMQLKQGELLRLRYRCLVHDNIWETARLQHAYDQYLKENGQ